MQPKRPNYASATCETHRNVGPKGIHGCVTLEFQRASEFQFSSMISWPTTDNYGSVVESAVRETLVELQLQHAFACRLVSIAWHPQDSCAGGFAFAARQATRAALTPFA
jgi:hypothetical protein